MKSSGWNRPGKVLNRFTKCSPLDSAPLWRSIMEAPPVDPPLARPFLANLSKAWACFSDTRWPSMTALPHFAGRHSMKKIFSHQHFFNYFMVEYLKPNNTNTSIPTVHTIQWLCWFWFGMVTWAFFPKYSTQVWKSISTFWLTIRISLTDKS